MSEWTFEKKQVVEGRRFRFQIPDQLAYVEECEGRPIAVWADDYIPGQAEESYMESPQVVYSALSGDNNAETIEMYRTMAIPETKLQMMREQLYNSGASQELGRFFVDDWIIEGVNCTVQVFRLRIGSIFSGLTPDAYEYYIKPLAIEHEDQLRLVDSFTKLDADSLRALAMAIAPTIELDTPAEFNRLAQLDSFTREIVDAESFTDNLNMVGNMLVMARNSWINADSWREIGRANGDVAEVGMRLPLIQARAVSFAMNESMKYFERYLDALAAQKRLGAEGYEDMWDSVREFAEMFLIDSIESDDEETAQAINATGEVRKPESYPAFHEKLMSIKPDGAL